MADIEQRLAAAAEIIDWPVTDLTARVRASVVIPTRRPRMWLRVAVVGVLVVITLAVATPWGRQAVADLFGITGITIRWGDTGLIGSELELGDRVTVESASESVVFPLLVPGDAPDAVYHDDSTDQGVVHMVWAAGERLPAAASTDVGVLYSQFAVRGTEMFMKTLDASSEVSEVTVRGQNGFWIDGAEHFVVFWDDSAPVEVTGRLAANVLAWVENGVTHRIETTGDLQVALDMAESLRPLD
jgi:hypothetical protein